VDNFPTAGTEASDAQAQGMKLDDPSTKTKYLCQSFTISKITCATDIGMRNSSNSGKK